MSFRRPALAVALVLPAALALCTRAAAQCRFAYANVDSSGAQANHNSMSARMSADGRYVAFKSLASNLIPNDGNNTWDAFRHDRATGATVAASVSTAGVLGNGMTMNEVSISDDGSRIAFESYATNLVAPDGNSVQDIFVHDFVAGTTLRASQNSAGQQVTQECIWPEISGDGRFVAFASRANNLVPNDTNNVYDIFVRDLALNTTEIVSVSSSGVAADSDCAQPWISRDGRFVLFKTSSLNFDPTKTSFYQDGFLRDRLLGITERFTLDENGGDPLGGHCEHGRCSADGRWFVWESRAIDLVPGHNDAWSDIFLRDRQSGTNLQITVEPSGASVDAHSFAPSISPDGRRVVFVSAANHLVANDTFGTLNAFRYERTNGELTLIDRLPNGLPGTGTSAVELAADAEAYGLATSGSNLGLPDVNGQVWLDIVAFACPYPTTYCTAKPNSLGCLPAIGSSGVPEPLPGFLVTCIRVLDGKPGVLFYGNAPAASPFQGGTLCVQAPVLRTAVQSAGGPPPADCTGFYAYDFGALVASGHDPLLIPGTRVWCQYWTRDPQSPSTTGLSDGLTFEIQP